VPRPEPPVPSWSWETRARSSTSCASRSPRRRESATDEESFLKDVCRILVSHGGYALAWIGRADRETMRVVPVASAGDEAGYLQRIEVRLDDTPEGRGPLGTAIRQGRPAIVSDIQVDPTVAPWRTLMLEYDFGSLAALPVRRGGTVTGGLAVYAAEKAFIGGEELALLEELAGDISYALDALDARARANKSELELHSLRRAVEQTHATVVITDLEGRIEYVNPSFTHVTGYTAEEARGQNPRFLKSDRTPPEVYRTLWETILGGRTWSGEICNERKDGTLFWELASISPIRDEAGVTRHYVAVKEDITERKRAEANVVRLNAELEEALEWQRQIFEGSRDAVFLSDEQGRFVAVNRAATDLTGFSREELHEMAIPDLHEESDLVAYRTFYRRILEGERILSEAPIKRKDGGKVAVEFNNSLVVIGGKRFVHTAGRDVTERRQLEAQLVQAQKMEAIGRLAGGVAHDFNNLLTVIQGYGELVRDSLSGDPRHESMDELLKAAGRATSLTRQLLAFSRKQVLEPKVVHLGEIVRETGRMLERLIGEEIALALVVSEDLATVKADPGQIEQVVLNLAVNARDSMPNGGQLTVSVGSLRTATPLDGFPDQLPAGRWVRLTVEDTGSGMDAETLSHAFEPFFTTKERGKGTGLGLSTVYGIVRQSGGHVQLTSVPGRGTTFQIYLPRSDERRVSGAHSGVFAVPGSETVLVVEDEPAVRSLVQAVLERHGYVVLVAEHGAAALDVVDKHPGPIHILLTDIVMPGMNGRDLAGVVTARRPSIRVIFMSGYTADIPTDLGVEGGPLFLSKPFSEQALTSKLREALEPTPT
jgi:two-component system cell cycle sensor histidine kinase/response regulator CckA